MQCFKQHCKIQRKNLLRCTFDDGQGYPCRYAQLKGNPVDIVAQDIARGTKILCLDELHVSDFADALILGQVTSDF